MARRILPKPTRRKGSLTLEIRTRIAGKIRTRTLRTRCYDTALQRVPETFQRMLSDYGQSPLGPSNPHHTSGGASLRSLTTSEICEAYRESVSWPERAARARGRDVSHRRTSAAVTIAADARKRAELELANARATSLLADHRNEKRFLESLAADGFTTTQTSEDVLQALARTRVETWATLVAQDNDPIASSAAMTREAARQTTLAAAPLLTALGEEYISERGSALTQEAANDRRAVIREFCAAVGDRPVTNYDKADSRKFKEILMSLPPNWRKNKQLRTLSIEVAAQTAKKLGLSRQSATTIQQKRNVLQAVFSFASDNYAEVQNPFAGGAAWLLSDTAAANQKDAFTTDELSKLMGSKLPRHLYWLTWLGLCTGARLNELCQLRSENVRTLGGVSHFYFSPDMRLKTNKRTGSSVRSVPLHPKLVQLGFLKYVEECDGPLFPNLPQHRTGRYSDAPSKAFRRQLMLLGMKRPGLSFHSLRHTFAMEFKRRAPTDMETRERLMGHHVSGVAGRYGGSYEFEANDVDTLRRRAKLIAKLKFDC